MNAPGRLSLDTSAAIEDRQFELWRRMTPQRKMEIVGDLCQAVKDIALAGIRLRYPGADDHECFLRLAILTLGAELAIAAYPGAARFGPVT